ncbi:MAG: wax ester/triacylglycerol synthase family O-acyltransferase [Deltaproteobacteria bacterium]|nr:wax ester/triacylglycerol synthase family O-acyltransferase [Deltaproteobacteria bacterium]MBW2420115.1 wax ester/triacylglycerol synthase family O-acyltransferase [Deltaproteobacteria bacterium]
MSETFFEPLSAMDRQFLEMEGPNAPMHVSGVSEYELGPLRSEPGSLDFGRVREAIESVLDRIPIYRQRLAWTPIEGRPGWIDDPGFELDYHLRQVALPAPGNESQLKELTALIVSQPLDRARPLWEMWFIEGLDGGENFAVVTKMHHCMIDGGSGANLMSLLMRASPDHKSATPKAWTPRPAPTGLALAAGEIEQRVSTPLRWLRGARRFQAQNRSLPGALLDRAAALRDILSHALPASTTPINGPLGRHRRVDWMETSLEDLTSLRRKVGCSLNDLALTVVTGALRRYLTGRGVEVDGLDFRVSVPVNVRREDEREKMGNRISSWILRLPLELAEPMEQLGVIRQRTGEARESKQALGMEMIMAAAEELPLLLTLAAWANRGQINCVVTNIPGPPIPLYFVGCRVRTMQPFVLLPPGVGLTVALLSYDGRLFWGFMADYDRVSDLGRFRDDVRDSLTAVQEAVTLAPAS